MSDQQEYQKYSEWCKVLRVKPRKYEDWKYCRYSAFEESKRLHDAELKTPDSLKLQKLLKSK